MTEFVEVKTAELKGPVLRYAVGLAVGFKIRRLEEGDYKPGEPHWWMVYDEGRVTDKSNGLIGYVQPVKPQGIYAYMPDLAWAQGGPLLERNYIELSIGDEEYWARRTCTSKYDDERVGYAGSSMLIAACRAIVGEKLGQTASVPMELLPC